MNKFQIFLIAQITFGFLLIAGCSSSPQTKSLVDGQLSSCPSSPNCIQTQDSTDQEHYSPALDLPEIAWEDSSARQKFQADLVAIIQEMEGTLVAQSDIHTHATFTSLIFRFVDDFELKIDTTQKKLHIRSASRTGHSDLGVNLERVEQFKALYQQKF